MITIRPLTTSEQIESACALLHDIYIERQKWNFADDNPSQLRAEMRNQRWVLVDRYTDNAIWFGAFDRDNLVGCVRLVGADQDRRLEVDYYPSSSDAMTFLNSTERDRCVEIQKVVTSIAYVGRGIVKRLMLACFRYCQEHRLHIVALTHNGYLQSLFRKIDFRLIREAAFKYEQQDASPVNIFFANWDTRDVEQSLKKLEYLENDISNNQRTIFKALQTIESVLPTPFYWMDLNGVVLGINDLCLKAIGTTREIVGKTPAEFYNPHIANHILRHNMEVICKEEILSQEEWIEDITTKERKCFSSIKAPLYDGEGSIVGIVGTSIEITAQKDAEALRLENEAFKVAANEQEKFRKLANHVAHDIRSPLSSMLMIIQTCENIPERERAALRRTATIINDIANKLVSSVAEMSSSPEANADLELEQPVLISVMLSELLTEKRYEHKRQPIKFEQLFTQAGNFAWIRVAPTSFKRIFNALIDNAVAAVSQSGEITVQLDADAMAVRVTVIDNGVGMPETMVNNLNNNTGIEDGKKGGWGPGLSGVAAILESVDATFKVESTVGIGTKVTMIFPRKPAEPWIADKIELTDRDIVVILDDDDSIHLAWDSRFEATRKQFPGISFHHFHDGQLAIDFMNGLPTDRLPALFLLTDYELLNQDLNGLDAIHQSQTHRSVLVTSHFADVTLRNFAKRACTVVLPKQLAYDVPIIVRAHAA